ncbi:MAG: DNA polymerase III subunit alpha [Chloroflexi bacterium]|nr:DNA polymerase III subunit alpha [Chloroflexota bacterium]
MIATHPEFVHLHVHSEYSLLDGLSRPQELVEEAAKHGMGAIALTDHGVMHGAIEFYQAARQRGIKPIIGVEAYIAARGMNDKESADRSSNHLTLLAKDATGYRNLLALVSMAHTDGFYYKPRIDHEALIAHREGLIALSGCASGEVPWAIRQEDMAAARRTAAFYRDLFGPEDYYLELQSHGIDFQPGINRELLIMAKELDLRLVCSNDSHYTRREDAEAQDLLLCIQTNTLFDDPKRMRMYTGEHYLKSPEEMDQLFGSEAPEALTNTLRVAERCELELDFGRLDFPKLPFIPNDEPPDAFLNRLCWDNLAKRYEQVTPEIENRLRYELDVVRTTGFAAYILFVWDFTDYARRQGIFCSPRGSAAGSLILYVIGITTIDPIRYALTFERFLNPERIQMPDIDMDFADSRRDEVIEYVAQRYGHDHVAQIITFGRLLARAALRDVGRALAYPLAEVDRVAKLIPTIPVGMTLDKSLAASEELAKLYRDEPSIHRLVDLARKVEGISRHASTHAAGIVVSGEPLVHHVPLQRGGKGDNLLMTQYEMHAVADIGLLKEDFLGLTNLTLLENAIKMIQEVRGEQVDVWNLPENDPKTFEMLANGDTTGVFQMEGAGMRRTVREFRPTTLDHLAAIVALYRPGPMANIPAYVAAKDGRAPITFLHPKLEPILRATYGVMVFQDQVLQIVQAVAGFTLGHADVLRNAMGKKIRAQMEQERGNFIEGAAQNGLTQEVAQQIWEYIEPFAGYGFNRAHAYCYANIAYQTAYLKCNYPAEYMAAMLTTQADDTEKIIAASGECRRLDLTLLPPDVNRSVESFTVEQDTPPDLLGHNAAGSPQTDGSPLEAGPARRRIRFGLAAIKNVGYGAAKGLIEERVQGGPYKSLDDLCQRLDLRAVNKRTLEALTKAGALDGFGPRERVLASLDRASAAAQQIQKAAGVGQASLFGADVGLSVSADLTDAPAPSDQQLLAWEKEAFGFYLTSHPFAAAAKDLASNINVNTSQLSEELVGERVILAGAVMQVRKVITKKQETMVVARIEDLHGSVEAVVFPRTYAANPALWREDAILVVTGRVEVRRMDSAGSDEETRGVPEILVQTAREWQTGESGAGSERAPNLVTPRRPGGSSPAFDGRSFTEAQDATFSGTLGRADDDFTTVEDEVPPIDEPPSHLLDAPATGYDDLASQTPSTPSRVRETPPPPPYPDGALTSQTIAASPSAGAGDAESIVLVVRESGDSTVDGTMVQKLHGLLSQSPGPVPYVIVFEGTRGRHRLVGDHLRVGWTDDLKAALGQLLGPDGVREAILATA